MGIKTFGDARQVIVETINDLRAKNISISRAMAIAANMKVLNDNIHMEIKAAKLSLEAEKLGKDFGAVMQLGRRPLAKGEPPLIEANQE